MKLPLLTPVHPSFFNKSTTEETPTWKTIAKAVGAGALGAGAGYGLAEASGMKAIGIMGGGSGCGAPFTPVSTVAGGVVGLAVLGLVCVVEELIENL